MIKLKLQNIVYEKLIIYISFFTALIIIPFFVYLEKYSFLSLILLFPLIYLWFDFNKLFLFFYIFSFFIGRYYNYELRLEAVTFISYFLIIFFIVNRKSVFFNNYALPYSLKISAGFLIVAVILSATISPFSSARSIFFSYLFFTFMVSSYIIFRLVSTNNKPDIFIKYYLYGAVISSAIIILQIITTGNLRSTGLSDLGIIDMLICGFLMVLFRYIILEKPNFKFIVSFILLFIVCITTQSRFAWLGFSFSFIYGLFICLRFERGFLKNKLTIIILILLGSFLLIYLTGLYSIIAGRLFEIKFSVLKSEEGGLEFSNSLDTRAMIWIVAIKTFLANPITGVGYMMFNYVSEEYNVLPEMLYLFYVKDLDPHSTFLSFLCETGAFGFFSFLFYCLIIYRYSMKAIKVSINKFEKYNSIVINIIVTFIIFHSIYAGSFNFGHNAFFMHFIFGLSIGNYFYQKNRNFGQNGVY